MIASFVSGFSPFFLYEKFRFMCNVGKRSFLLQQGSEVLDQAVRICYCLFGLSSLIDKLTYVKKALNNLHKLFI